MSDYTLEDEFKLLLDGFKPSNTTATEKQALELLSQFPKPETIKSIKDKFENVRGWSLLHYACYRGWYEVVKKLIVKYNCIPDANNNKGETPLYWACGSGHLSIVRYLISEHRCDPECRERELGWTPFQQACYSGHLDIVKYLVAECDCDPLKPDKDGETPLWCAACLRGHYDVVSFLVTTGKLDKASNKKLQLHSNEKLLSLVTLRRNHPFHPAFKVFVVGNQSAGKSTLVKALENRLTHTRLLGSVTGRFKKVSGVELRTAGIIPTHVHSPKLGHVTLYDFAGQYEYYSSHAAYLENLVSSPGVLFLLVVDISKNTEEIIRTLQYWSSFIANLCNRCNNMMPQVVVVGSHADVAISQNDQPNKKLSIAFDKLDRGVLTILEKSKVVINCTQAASSSLSTISDIIATCSQAFHKECEVDMQVHLLNGVIKKEFRVAAKFRPVSEFVSSYHGFRYVVNQTEHNLLPTDDATLSKHLTTLTEHGQLLFLRNEEDANDSWVIINKELLLSQVNGTIFAPEYFKQHHDVSNSTGVVPLSEIKKVFPEYDPQMIVSFLTHLEFCHQIGESEASLISAGRQIESCNTALESYYFFPALVIEERPEESCKSIIKSGKKSGWCLKCIRDAQFFTSRFFHVLLLRLTFKFALNSDSLKSKPCPVVQRECNVWKCGLTDGGIHWINMDGVEAIVEVIEQSTAVTVVIGCQEGGEMACIQLRSDLIRTILEVKENFSGAVETRESFINPSELASYPLKKTKDLSTFSIDKIVTAVSTGKKFVTSKQGFEQQKISVDQLLTFFEPFTSFSIDVLANLFQKSEQERVLDAKFLNTLGEAARHYVNEFQELLQVPHNALRDAVRNSPPSVRDDPAHCCYLLFKIWKEQGHRNYGDLRSALDKYSVFCGRNPLVLAGAFTPLKMVEQCLEEKTEDSMLVDIDLEKRMESSLPLSLADDNHVPRKQKTSDDPLCQPLPNTYKLLERSMVSDITAANDSDEHRNISATACWEINKVHSKLNGDGIVIAILDSGVNVESHSAFQSAYKEKRIVGLNFVPGDADSAWRTQPQGHGSMAAFIAAGNSFTPSKSSDPIPSGVAPKSTLIICRIGDGKNYSKEAVIRALKKLIELKQKGENLDIVSMSFGCIYDPTDDDQAEIQDMIKQLESHNVVLVASAGNYGKYRDGVTFPAIMDSVIAVGALNHYGYRRDSNASSNIDIFAPGEGIAAPSVESQNGVTFHNGSSCAAPAVAGLIALVLQYARDYVSDGNPREKGKYRNPLYLKSRLFGKDMKRGDPDLLEPYEFFKDKLQ